MLTKKAQQKYCYNPACGIAKRKTSQAVVNRECNKVVERIVGIIYNEICIKE